MHAAALTVLLVIRAYDLAGLPAHDLARGARVTGDILRAAGIEMIWVDCTARVAPAAPAPERCGQSAGPTDVIVRFVAGRLDTAADDVLGFAYVDAATTRGTLATVFADRVAGLAQSSAVDAGTLLGRVVAHETGHLLLGTTAHCASGLMRANWSSRALHRGFANDWLFSRAEARQIQERFAERFAAGGPTLATASLRGSF